MRNPRAAPAYRGGKLKRETRLAAFMGFMQRVRETRAQKLLMVATVNVRDNDAPTPGRRTIPVNAGYSSKA